MQVSELIQRLEARPAGLDCLVVTTDNGSKIISSIKDVVFETHEDADGSTTCWVIVEEV